MERYIAFLRGINVSGQKIIKMEPLRKVLAESGLSDVKTFIQSGNILFNSEIQETNILILKLESLIEKHFAFRTDVILRRYYEIESIVDSPFFGNVKLDDNKKVYVTFLKEENPQPIPIPSFSKNKDVEIIFQNAMEMISISSLYKGTFGFPNSFIEKLTGITATTRNPNTLEKIVNLR